VYALGAILYEMLTGRPPFLAETVLDTLLQVRSLDPVPPRRLQPKVPRDLETICLKRLQKEPARRYASAEALADDLSRFRQGKPILARPVRVWVKAGKWARRQPLVAALLLLLALVISGSGVGLTALLLRAERHLADAQAAEADTQAMNDFLVNDLLAAARPEEQGREVTIRQALDAAVPKLEAAFAGRPGVEASVRDAIGYTYFQLGLHALAEPQLRRSRDLLGDLLGPEHPAILHVTNNLALLLHAEGKLAEAEELCRHNLETRRRRSGPDHPDTLLALHNVALGAPGAREAGRGGGAVPPGRGGPSPLLRPR
jgi:hypothetical protein